MGGGERCRPPGLKYPSPMSLTLPPGPRPSLTGQGEVVGVWGEGGPAMDVHGTAWRDWSR